MEVRGIRSVILRWTLCLILLVLTGLNASSFSANVSYEYDAAGRLKKSTYPDGTVVNYTLDAAGNRASVVTTTNPGIFQFYASPYSANENNGYATVYVNRAGGAYGAVSINYATANSTAIAGQDYTAVSGTLNWANGEMYWKEILVPISWDSVSEGDEVFTVVLSSPIGGATLGTPTSMPVTIVNVDQPPPQQTFESSYYGAYFYEENSVIYEGYYPGFGGSLSPTTTSDGYTIQGLYRAYDQYSGTATATLMVSGPGGAAPSSTWVQGLTLFGSMSFGAPDYSVYCDFGTCWYTWWSSPWDSLQGSGPLVIWRE